MRIKSLFMRALTRVQAIRYRKKIAIIAGLGIAFILVLPIFTYAYFAQDINDRERLMNRNDTGIVLLDKNGETIYQYGNVNHRDNLKLSDISDDVERALVATEDQEFYSHKGYSLRGMVGALYANVLRKNISGNGGSTISQQLVKNRLFANQKNYLRKFQEVSLAIALERHYSKDEILEMYLNSVYFGEGAFGISAAADTYFGKTPAELNLAESSMLVGLLPAPSVYSPISGDAEKAKQQQEWVLSRMVRAGHISEGHKTATQGESLAFQPARSVLQEHAHHFAMMALDELKERYGDEEIIRAGFQVTTTLDLGWQKHAEEQVRNRVNELKSLGGTNASLVAIDPKNGEIRALVGSVDWHDENFGKVNMALASRQPGSSFKPIYYTEAMDRGIITPATILSDRPITYGSYKPENFDFSYNGDITVRKALALSKNIPAIEIMNKLGPKEASEGARRMGISTVTEPEKYGLTLGVGTAEVKLLELANAYAALANHGDQYKTSTIISIKDKFNQERYTKRADVPSRVIGEEAAFLTSSILSDKQAHAPTFSSLDIPNRQVAVKTGTTDKNHDAWTMGYTPSLVVGVWVGNNANEPMSGIAGASGAGPLWRKSMERFIANLPNETFQPPSGVDNISVCRGKGLPADGRGGDTYKEFFKRDTIPKERCNAPKVESDRTDKEEGRDPEKKEEENEEGESGDDGGRGGDAGEELPPVEEQPPPPEENPPPEEQPPPEESGTTPTG